MVHVEPLGILLGTIFVVSVSSLLIWMFRVPKGSTMSAAKAYSSLSSVHKVLVAITDAFPSERAIGLGCRIGQEQGAEMLLLNVILIPYSMALDDPAPAEEEKANHALDMGVNKRDVRNLGVSKRQVTVTGPPIFCQAGVILAQ